MSQDFNSIFTKWVGKNYIINCGDTHAHTLRM